MSWSGLRWPLRCRPPGLPDGSQGSSCCFGGNDRQHGRTAQVHVRAIARTNGKAGQNSASRDMQQAAMPIRVRNAGEVPASGAGCLREAKIERWPRRCFRAAAALCFKHRAPGVPMACRYTWRRGRGETPGVPHAPFGGKGTEKTGFPCAGSIQGAILHVHRRAKRRRSSNGYGPAQIFVWREPGKPGARWQAASFETRRPATLLRLRV